MPNKHDRPLFGGQVLLTCREMLRTLTVLLIFGKQEVAPKVKQKNNPNKQRNSQNFFCDVKGFKRMNENTFLAIIQR